MLDLLLTIVSFVLVLGMLVFFHELGHYWVARRNGIVVEEFGFGYPPRAIKLFRYDGTDFTLNWLPLGGFARMKGEDAGDISAGSFNAAGRGARAAVLIAGPAMNFFLAIVLFAASFMAGFPVPAGAPQIIDAGAAAVALGLQEGDIVLAYANTPVQVPIVEDGSITILAQRPNTSSAMALVSRSGTVLEIAVTDSAALWAALEGSTYRPVLITEVTALAKQSPAQLAGIQDGDLIYAVDGETVTADMPLNDLVSERLGQQLTLTVLRDGSWQEIEVTPRVDPPPGEGALGVQISYINRMATMGLLASLREGFVNTGSYATIVLSLPVLLFQGQLTPEQAQVSGPVGIAQMVGGAVSASIDTGFWFPILRLSAVLSAALAITNLLPLPALDGGRLLFILIEAIRGRRVSPEREGLIHMVGFALLLGLMLIITIRDLSSAPQTIDWARLMGQ